MSRRNHRHDTTAPRSTQDPVVPQRTPPKDTVDRTFTKRRERVARGDELAERAAAAATELAPRPIGDLAELDSLTAAPLLAELAELRAENARLRGDEGPPASEAQVAYLTRLVNRLSRRDAAAVIAYLAGWKGWSKRQQSAAMMRLQALSGRDALEMLPDPRKAEGGAQ